MSPSTLQTPSLTISLPRNSECTHSPTNSGYQSYVNSLGPIEEGTAEKILVKITDEERARLQRVEARPSLAEILNLHDFEV
jgi:hypothetical protein